jgi:hypothetical protein
LHYHLEGVELQKLGKGGKRMSLLLVAGIVVLVFGGLLLLMGGFCKHPCEACDRVIFVLDEILSPFRVPVGVVLLAIGGWMFYLVMQYPANYLLHPVWVIMLVFGLLFAFLPHWLTRISAVMNRTVFHTDMFVLRFCKIIGITLLLAAVYIIYISLTL